MEKPHIVAYLKTSCGWSKGVRAILHKYEIDYTEKDIILNPEFRREMEQRSGQSLSPCVEVNGVMLPDLSGQELEEYLLQNRLVEPNDSAPEHPIHSCCSSEKHAARMASAS